jgi:hypothetical protein
LFPTVVAVEVESPEIHQSLELRGNVPPEIPADDGDPDDARVGEPRDIHARNAAPTARRGVILVPVGESQANVRHLIYGRFQRQQRQAVWGERECEFCTYPKINDDVEEEEDSG